jgi:hypothetical protein
MRLESGVQIRGGEWRGGGMLEDSDYPSQLKSDKRFL